MEDTILAMGRCVQAAGAGMKFYVQGYAIKDDFEKALHAYQALRLK